MSKQPKVKAIVAGILIATAATMIFDFYYRHQAIPALAMFGSTGKVYAPPFSAFGYNGYITRGLHNSQGQSFGGGGPVNIDVNDGAITPVTFSYVSMMFISRSWKAWLIFGVTLGVTAFLALGTRYGSRVVMLSGWFQILFGILVLVGGTLLKGYFGLGGLVDPDSIPFTNLFAGLAFALLGWWLTTGQPAAQEKAAEVGQASL